MRCHQSGRSYSPSDLIAYLEGDFAAWCERLFAERRDGNGTLRDFHPGCQPDPTDEEGELVRRKGSEHELRYLAGLRERYPDLVEIRRYNDEGHRSTADTLQAMRAGVPVIFQGRLVHEAWHGYPDFLFRVDGPSLLGAYHYEPWDTKLARSAKPYFLVQLCAYADLLEATQGVRPASLVFVLGNDQALRFRTDDFFYYYRALTTAFLDFEAAWSADRLPHPGLDRGLGDWSVYAERLMAEWDHLSRVATITRGQIRKLEAAGITTSRQLAESDGDLRPPLSNDTLQRLRVQARLQLRSERRECPECEPRRPPADRPHYGLALLPPSSPHDVFFDMEGFPYADGGLEYLFGAVTVDTGAPEFRAWWAHDARGERQAFEQFMDWVHARWTADPTMHIYHYAAYEKSALCRLMGKYASREAQMDDLLRGEVFVDLYTVVRQGFIVGTPSYSLKDIERLYLPPRAGDVRTAGGSVVAYQHWLDRGEPADPERSATLRAIRDYNRLDCESTFQLRNWLMAQQSRLGVMFLPMPRENGEVRPLTRDTELLAAALLAKADAEAGAERQRITRLLGYLVAYHRREDKPGWRRMFDRVTTAEEELYLDPDCLAGLERTDTPPRPIKRSWGLEYRFDPDQDTKLHAESRCFVVEAERRRCTIETFDAERGLLELKVGAGEFPRRLSLMADEHVSADPIIKAVARYAGKRLAGEPRSGAVEDLLYRRPPRIEGQTRGVLVPDGPGFLQDVIALATRMERTTLCIQGPPGTGKTFTAAAIIASLLEGGKRVGVTANSHAVVMNLMSAIRHARTPGARHAPLIKVGDDDQHPLIQSGAVHWLKSSGDVAAELPDGPCVVGGTAWLFSRDELEGAFDYLFVDEAGQVPLANAVAVGQAAANLVLIGDPMQLSQPTQVVHPEESGQSCLEYMLQGHATIPADFGVFLGLSRRMHPDICRFISETFYEGRLRSHEDCARQAILHSGFASRTCFVPVPHENCDQDSEEESAAIEQVVAGLRAAEVMEKDGRVRPLRIEDVLIVAPFNKQVRRLRERLGAGARVGTVDKFQGQEAPVVIVSLCASTIEEAPRGAEFLLSPNRLNVAISRAQALAIVVGSPELLKARCRTVEEMKLVNRLCRLVEYCREGAS